MWNRKVVVILMAATAMAFAQMTPGGGRMMGPGNGTGRGMGTGMQGGMSGMAAGPVVGADGTAYVLRQTTSTSMSGMPGGQQTTRTELVAINPSNGRVNWALAIDAGMISEPVLSKDGTILLTTFRPGMDSGMDSGRDAGMGSGMGSDMSAQKPALLIIAPTASSARVQARVPIDADMVSAPVVTPDGQTIYVVATSMADDMGMSDGSGMATFLFGFGPGAGSLKFKVQLR